VFRSFSRLCPALRRPAVAQLAESVTAEHLFEEREDVALFALEMFAGGTQGQSQQMSGVGQRGGGLDFLQATVYLVVILVQFVELALVVERVVQRDVGQIGFRGAVFLQQRFHQRTQQLHFFDGAQAGQLVLNGVEDGREHRVFRDESLCNRKHG